MTITGMSTRAACDELPQAVGVRAKLGARAGQGQATLRGSFAMSRVVGVW